MASRSSPSPASQPSRSLKHSWIKNLWAIAKVAGPVIASVAALVISTLTYLNARQAELVAAQANQVASETANQAQQRSYAERVSYWLTGSGDSTQISVENQSDQAITDVMIMVVSTSVEQIGPDSKYIVDPNVLPAYTLAPIALGTVPPCSVMKATFENAARINMVQSAASQGDMTTGPRGGIVYVLPPYDPGSSGIPPNVAQRKIELFERTNGFPVRVQRVVFTDANGLTWNRGNNGELISGDGYGDQSNFFWQGEQSLDAPVSGNTTPADGCF
jgi:hypothetical protein